MVDRVAHRRLLILGLAGTVAIVLLLALADHDGSGAAGIPAQPAGALQRHLHRSGRPVEVTVALDGRVAPIRVPRSFFGLSTEYPALPQFEAELPLFERVLAQLHAHDNGPLLLRVGGDSADHSFWDPRARRVPDWAYALTPGWLALASALVHQTGARLILDLNLVTASPAIAGQWARAARAGLPHGSIAGFEVGNEPDIYNPVWWREVTSPARFGAGAAADLPRDLTPAGYTHDVARYERVLARAAPGIPLVGPALANPVADSDWLTTLLRSAHRSLAFVTIHRYPYSGCALPGTSHYPTVKRLLGPVGTSDMAARLRPLVADARRYRLTVRLSELNSINCGGRPGISNAFATALWAPDALFSLLRAGVSGVNLHVRANTINAPFSLGRRGLTARPLLYGLITFVRALGADSSLIGVRVQTARRINVRVWAVRTAGGGLNILLIDKSWLGAHVRLVLGDRGPLRVQRLLAPSPAANGGVTLGGQRLGAVGQWVGRARTEVVRADHGVYDLSVGKFSAALAVVH